jgi:hypothetical protein
MAFLLKYIDENAFRYPLFYCIILCNYLQEEYMPFCANCGTQYQDGVRFCPRCGAPAINQPAPPPPPVYAPPPQQPPYGYPQQQPMYGGMQYQYSGGKSKTAAVLLAFFLSAWTWLYTFKRDKGKFIATFLIGLVLSIAFVATQSYAVVVVIYIFYGIIWLWAFFGALFRSSDWYRMY